MLLAMGCMAAFQASPATRHDEPAQAAGAAEPEPFVAWMRSVHDDWLVPGYADLHQKSLALGQSLEQLCLEQQKAPAIPSALPASQQAWRDTMRTWRRLEALQLGPTLAHKTSKRIDFWPTRPRTIESAAAATDPAPVSGREAEIAMMRWGAAGQGLPALEWLIFPVTGADLPPAARSAAHCRYALRVGYMLTLETERLLSAWNTEAKRWHDTPPDLQGEKYKVLNLLAGSIELLRGKKLEKAAALQALGPVNPREERLDNFDSMRSRNTKLFLLTHVEGVAQILLGRVPDLAYTAAAPAAGLSSVLRAERQEQTARAVPRGQMVAEVAAVHRAVSALPDDPRAWSTAQIAPVARALGQLRGVLDADVARRWRVTIDFTDADGD